MITIPGQKNLMPCFRITAGETASRALATNRLLIGRLAMVIAMTAFFGIMSGFLLPDMARAQSATCRALQAQLAQLDGISRSAPSKRYQQYDRAVRDQQAQIQKTEYASRKNGCQFVLTNICARIKSSLSKMYANLDSLQATRQQFANDTPGNSQDRKILLRELQNNRCGSAQPVVNQPQPQNDKPRRRTLLEQIFGTKTYTNEGSFSEFDPNEGRRFGTYRTLCVRTCDGYYFPISFSTTQERFEKDAEQCQQMCPGSETRLYFHEMPGGDAETSISYPAEEPYASMTNAFAYRKAVNPECSCRTKPGTGFQEIAGTGDEAREVGAQAQPKIGTPVWRQDPDMDLQSLENIAGGLTLEILTAMTNGEDQISQAPKTGQIRIVGPAFFPVQ
jgi:hypothetical protein